MMVFMDTTATIVTGACAERWSYKSFFIFSILIGGFIYPIFGCWVWGGGWLAQLGYRSGLGHGAVDYAGSGVVHLQGGALALITAYLIGPRIGKYDKDGKAKPILAAPHPDGAARHVHPRVRLVRLQRRQLARRHRRPHRHRRGQHHDRRHVGDAGGILYMWIVARQARSDDDVQQHARRPGRHHRAVRVRHARSARSSSAPSPACSSSGACSSSTSSRSTIRSAPSASTASTALWGVLAVGLFADGSYGSGWNGVGATEYLGTSGAALKGVTGLFYGDSKQLIAQLIEVGVAHRLERRRRRRWPSG